MKSAGLPVGATPRKGARFGPTDQGAQELPEPFLHLVQLIDG